MEPEPSLVATTLRTLLTTAAGIALGVLIAKLAGPALDRWAKGGPR